MLTQYATVVKNQAKPTDVPSITGWWDGSDHRTILTNASGNCSAWYNKAATREPEHLLQGSGGEQPLTGTRRINGHNVLDFDGGDDFVNRSWELTNSMTFIFVGIIDSVDNSADSIFSIDDLTADFQMQAGNASQFQFDMTQSSLGITSLGTSTDYVGALHSFVLRLNADTGLAEIFVDGGTAVDTDGGYNGSLDTSAELMLMTNRAENQFTDGAVATFMVANTALSNKELNYIMQDCVQPKWGADWTEVV